MFSSENPNGLLIDQPEDNHYSEFSFLQLAPVIRLAEEHLQITLVTHNPNIAVFCDAKQIVVLSASNEKFVIVERASIDYQPTRERVCNLLEGAKAASTRRGRIYGLA